MQMRSNGNIFSLSISLPCLFSESVKKYEPTVPLPERRVSTLKTVHEYGIPAMVAIRPLLPDVSEEELLDIVKLTKDYVVGYYSGPLYLKKETVKFLLPDFVSDKEEKQPNWMLDGNTFQIIEKEGQMERLISIVEKSGRRFFIGAADGMDYIRNLEKYEKPRN